jgi:hypothetical protein
VGWAADFMSGTTGYDTRVGSRGGFAGGNVGTLANQGQS